MAALMFLWHRQIQISPSSPVLRPRAPVEKDYQTVLTQTRTQPMVEQNCKQPNWLR